MIVEKFEGQEYTISIKDLYSISFRGWKFLCVRRCYSRKIVSLSLIITTKRSLIRRCRQKQERAHGEIHARGYKNIDEIEKLVKIA